MTYCANLAKPLVKRIEAGESLNEIAKSLCGNTVKRPRQKVVRIIKELLGKEYLIEHAESLGYNTQKAVRTKSTCESVKRKILSNSSESVETLGATTQCEPSGEHQQQANKTIYKLNINNSTPPSESKEEQGTTYAFDSNEIVSEVMKLVERFGFNAVMETLTKIQNKPLN